MADRPDVPVDPSEFGPPDPSDRPSFLVEPMTLDPVGPDDRHVALYAAATTHGGQQPRLVTMAADAYLKWLRDNREDPDG